MATGQMEAGVRMAVREVESHAATGGWDQPPRLFALVQTRDLVAQEPKLAARLGLDAGAGDGLTPVEQEVPSADRPFEEVLTAITWPSEVIGCAAVLERVVLPPAAEERLPDDSAAVREYAAEHPERQEVRMAAAVLRDGTAHCALRLRTHDRDEDVLDGPDLVPALVELLSGTLED